MVNVDSGGLKKNGAEILEETFTVKERGKAIRTNMVIFSSMLAYFLVVLCIQTFHSSIVCLSYVLSYILKSLLVKLP